MMELNGREVGFRRSVLATVKIAEICPNKDITKLGEMLTGDIVTGLETAVTFVCALSEAYETHKKREDPTYTPNPLTAEEVYNETEEVLGDLIAEAIQAYQQDGKPTVETAPVKGKNGEAASE